MRFSRSEFILVDDPYQHVTPSDADSFGSGAESRCGSGF
jgi:hypothetical protein